MKNFTQKFIGLLALVFTMSFTANAQFTHTSQTTINDTSSSQSTDTNIDTTNSTDNNSSTDNTITITNPTIDQDDSIATQNMPLDLPQGWSMFGYTCIDSVDAMVGFSEITDKIEIVKDEWGLSYLPSWEFNAMGSLQFSEGYQIKMIEEVTDFQFCEAIVPEDGISQSDVDAVQDLLDAIIPEDGVTQADVDAAVAEVESNSTVTDSYHLMLIGDCLSGDGYACIQANNYGLNDLPYEFQACFNYQDNSMCEIAAEMYPEEMANYLGLTNYELDECGVPNGDNSSCTDECGVLNGDNSSCLDECGVPNGDNSTCSDECGVVNGDNSSCLDDCGVINGDNSTCLDCAGVVNGTSEDLGCGCGNPQAQAGYDCDGNEIELQIGDQHAGGIVFQINEDGTGLVADLQDLGLMDWYSAMDAALSATSQGYDDWYLPSIEELELMYNTIGNGGPEGNIGGFGNNWYWSSSEYGNNYAWSVYFSNGNAIYYVKGRPNRVRVIRAF